MDFKFPFHLDSGPGPAYLRVAAPPGFAAGFSLRPGGYSRGPFAAANMSFAVGDRPDRVAANRVAIRARASRDGLVFTDLVTVRQVHGNGCLVVDDDFQPPGPETESVEADALITARPGLLLGIQTADCLPLIMISEEPMAVAVVHAGWRGLARGVGDAALRRLVEVFGVDPGKLKVYAGPAIGYCCFEVGPEVIENFCQKPYLAGVSGWYRNDGERDYLDLVAVQRAELLALGVEKENFKAVEICTICHDFCFSYRRDRGITGRQLAFAGIGWRKK